MGSINLSEFVDSPYTKNAKFNFKEFKKAVAIAVEALDTIIDENLDRHALKEQSDNSKNYRNIGLGCMGYANMLFKLGLTYGSEDAIIFTDKLFNAMLYYALNADINLAKNKGAFPKCKPNVIVESNIICNLHENYLLKPNIEKYGLRNCTLLSIAPTGSIATMLGVSGGCEPEFALSYQRRTDNLNESYDVYCKSVKEYWEMTNNKIDKGNINSLPEYFVTSKDINWKNRIDTQAVMQNYIDTAISSTINLPKETKLNEIENLYLYAWASGLKGITIYRSGCKRQGILTTDEQSIDNNNKKENNPTKVDSNKEIDTLPRGYIIKVNDDLIGYKKKITNGCGKFHFSVFFDDVDGTPYETFIDMGDGGGCERNLTFISKLMSKALRAGVPLEEIIETAKSVRPCKAYTNRTKKYGDTSKGTSCPSAIGWALEELNNKIQDRCFADFDIEESNIETSDLDTCDSCNECSYVNSLNDKETNENKIKKDDTQLNKSIICPECKSKLTFEGGCMVCKNCGWSKCD